MKNFIITVASIAIAVLIVTTFLLGDTNSLKSESERIGNGMVTEMQEIETDIN